MKNKVALLISGVNLVLFAGLIIYISDLNQKKEPKALIEIEASQHVINIDIPETLSFAGESVPIQNQLVKEAFDKELQINTYWHSSTLSLIKNSNKWFPVIEPILKEHGIPDDFKYLALIESGLQNVVSPRGAAGFWQIMKGTGRDYGLEINKDVDERYHVEKATEFACKYLQKAYKKYNDWTLAAASYNAGQARISKQLKAQSTDSYYDLYLNTETGRYVYRILAIKKICENPEYHGFHIDKTDLYPVMTFEEIKVKTGIKNLVSFAKQHGMDYKTFKAFNPWCRNTKLRNSKKKEYIIKKPDAAYEKHLVKYSQD